MSEASLQLGDAPDILDGLNSPQAEAVCLPLDTHGAILAGAGTGKTRVLVHPPGWCNRGCRLRAFSR
ncbi:hypothetical protein GGI1_23826 [Acidithiobacillus sp. GGI-221]|nr:hypothetical protein GGI1_23826 [Acidithiobacillus sp. GGI-221]